MRSPCCIPCADKFTEVDELAYKSGIDTAPEKDPDHDKLHLEHVQRMQDARSRPARLAALEATMAAASADRLNAMHVSRTSAGQAELPSGREWRHVARQADEAARAVASNTHGERVAPVDAGSESDSDSDADSLFADDDNAGDGSVARLVEDMRRARIAELKQRAAAAAASSAGASSLATSSLTARAAGLMVEIAPETFAEEVSAASQNGPVVLLVYRPAHAASEALMELLAAVSTRFPSTKFVKMAHSSALQSVPLGDCPVVMAYRRGRPMRQWATLDGFCGAKTTADDVEWALSKVGAVPSEMTEDPREAALFD